VTTTHEFDRSMGSLADVFVYLDTSLESREVDERSRLVLHLAVEELFTNMVKYNAGSRRRISVRVLSENDRVRVELVDPDSEPFDPTTHGPVDTSGPIEQRKRGGLGIHLVRAMVDGFDYEYEGREMTVSVTKNLE
jgi:serine/threonine-protein kinase RsbW